MWDREEGRIMSWKWNCSFMLAAAVLLAAGATSWAALGLSALDDGVPQELGSVTCPTSTLVAPTSGRLDAHPTVPDLEWPTLSNNMARQGHSPWQIDPDALTLAWSCTVTGDIFYSHPVVAHGYVYVASGGSAAGLTGYLNKIDLATGINTPLYTSPTTQGLMRATATVSDGLVFFGTGGDSTFVCYNESTGTLVWTATHDGIQLIKAQFRYAPPVVADGLVYFGGDGGVLFCVDEYTGIKVWEFPMPGNIYNGPTLGTNGLLYIGHNYAGLVDYYLYALDPTTGATVWSWSPQVHGGSTIHDGFSSVTYYDHPTLGPTLYFGTGDFNLAPLDGHVYCLDADTGTMIWAVYNVGSAQASSPVLAEGPDQIVAIIGSHDLYTMTGYDSEDGTLVWQYTPPATSAFSVPPALASNNVVFCAGQLGFGFAAWDAFTGSLLWNVPNPLGTNAISGPCITKNPYGPGAYVIFAESGYLLTPPNGAVYCYYDSTATLCPDEGWYFKDGYKDYAPIGVPDFDEKQDSWMTPDSSWTFCGPTAVANCFWWFDSKFNIPPGVPGDGWDRYPLVRDYQDALPPNLGPGPLQDDHSFDNVDHMATFWFPGGPPPVMPPFVPGFQNPPLPITPWGELVERLAWYMDTDGVRTGAVHKGTKVIDMEEAIDLWLEEAELSDRLFEHTEPHPDFYWIEEEIEKCQDVILLLGFWEEYPPSSDEWWRIGGHFVTCAGVNSDWQMLAFSDPFFDNAELGFPGNVYSNPNPWGLPHPPPPHPPTAHNDAWNASHDFYQVWPNSPTPSEWWIPNYPVVMEPYLVEGFFEQNCPEELLPYQAPWMGGPIHVEIEYAVVVSPVVSVRPIPDNPVVKRGETLGVTLRLWNQSAQAQTFWGRIDVTLPNGQPFPGNPILGPRQVTMNPGQQINFHVSHMVPQGAPLGVYGYTLKIGWPPATFIDYDRMTFEVIAAE
jgi:outer membrane protein assembly factor BamB